MRKYGVNWLLFYPGFLAAAVPTMVWAGLMLDLLWPYHDGQRVMSRVVSWGGQLFCQGLMAFWLARENAKQKAKAAQALEGEPFVTPTASAKNGRDALVTPATPRTMRLRRTFGIGSAIVGAVSLAAHLVSGKVGVRQIIAYTVCVPLCMMLGAYLMEKAREPAVGEAQTAHKLPLVEEAAPCVTPTVELLPYSETQPVTASQRH